MASIGADNCSEVVLMSGAAPAMQVTVWFPAQFAELRRICLSACGGEAAFCASLSRCHRCVPEDCALVCDPDARPSRCLLRHHRRHLLTRSERGMRCRRGRSASRGLDMVYQCWVSVS